MERVFAGALLSMHEMDTDPYRRWKWLGLLSAAAVLLHVAALSGLEWAWPARDVPPLPMAAVQVRLVDAAVPAEVPVEVATRVGPVVTVAPERAKPIVLRDRARPLRTVATQPVPVPVIEAPVAPLRLALATPAPSATPASAAAAGDETIPHYRTRMPPAATLRYEMQRGLLSGTGDLSWRPQGDHYELKLEAKVGGLSVLTQVSAGAFDAAGVAPQRFTDQRLRRGTTAANFQREAGKITFSGPLTEYALRDGAQDRLSWMVQLAAIVAAEPHLAQAGARVAMYVVGSHGDAGVWVFRCLGPEAVSTGAGTVDAIKFTREPREAYDTTVQVWLDPAQHDLPVRATQRSGPNDEGFELRLQEVILPN